MNAIPKAEIWLAEPRTCRAYDLEGFERLVRLGFDGSDSTLPTRIRAARTLAFCPSPEGGLGAIAALKVPTVHYRDLVFAEAHAGDSPVCCRLELGWVYVAPNRRRKGIARALCQRLLEEAPETCVFATTRQANLAMIGLLESLGFRRVGRAYPWRQTEHVLFLRSADAAGART